MAGRAAPRTTPARRRASLLSLAAVLIAAAFATPAQASLTAVSTVVTPPGLDPLGTGLPAWYQDPNLVQLGPCDDGTPNCFGVTAAGFINGTIPEVFFNRAVARMTTPTGELLEQILALQAAPNASGSPAVIQRIRTRVTGGAPNATYTVIEPFGAQTITTNATGVGTTTQDIGCPIVGIGPCDFSLALAAGAATAAGTVGPFISWDAGAPPGYVGDARTPHTIVGGTNGNTFSISGGDLPGVMSTNLYVVTGKLAAVIAGAPVSWANQLVGTPSPSQNVTVVNNSPNPVTISAVALAGTNPADFAKTAAGDLCTGTTLNQGQTCTVGVTFTPAAAGARTAQLSFTDTGAGSPHLVSLNGAALVPPPAPTVDLTPGTYTSAQHVTLSDPDPAAVIHYTLDGTTPTPASPTATGPIIVSVSETLKAIGVHGTVNGGPNASAVASFAYVIQPPAAPAAPAAGSGALNASSAHGSLAFTAVSVSKRFRLRLVRKHGLQFTLGLPAGTSSVHVRIVRHTRKSKKPLVIYTRDLTAPARGGRWTLTLPLNRIGPGRYAIDIAPRDAAGMLGKSVARAFVI